MNRIDLGAMVLASDSGAWISECGRYRYALWRVWDREAPPMPVCMLNPSTADAMTDDPTIRRVVGFAKREGFGGILVVNLFPLRATDPAELLDAADRTGGIDGEAVHVAIADYAAQIMRPMLVGWGALHPRLTAQFVVGHFRSRGAHLVCLGKTKGGHPRHPLYIKSDQPMVAF